MEPLPPSDAELRIIIDKLAVFVARNGPEFEEMTKSKQKSNPKFAFLFGGEFYNYYAWKVTSQQKALGHPEPGWPPEKQPSAVSLSSLEAQKQSLRDQIRESESNLRAQEDVSSGQLSLAVGEAISKGRAERLELLAGDTGLSTEELSRVLQPIIDSCTKDSISGGKSWIFAHATSHDRNQLIAHYLSYRVTQEDASFPLRLHLIYLMNDVLHHCIRKNADELKHSLEAVAVEMFCAAATIANEDQSLKLNKLIHLWESKAIFSASTLAKMRVPPESWASYKEELKEDYKAEIAALTDPIKATLESYKAQHSNFLSHANANIQSLNHQIDSIREEESRAAAPPDNSYSQEGMYPPTADYPPPPPWSEDGSQQRPSRWDESSQWRGPPQTPSSSFGPPPVLPDLSRPPPGFNPSLPPPSIHPPPHVLPLMSINPLMDEKALQPTLPYYDLPAGLMVPLVRLEDAEYARTLDPSQIRLPPPTPPTERLLAAVDAFYSQPSHESPRDLDGFEILGLFEFSKEKNAALEKRKADIRSGLREETPPPSPDQWSLASSPEPPSQQQQVVASSSSPVKKRPKRRSYRSRTRSRSGSRESTPEQRRARSSRRSPSPGYSSYLTKRSPSPRRGGRRRSPSPVEGGDFSRRSGVIDSSNKGHQMMQRMGWKSGTGLGSSESGIVEPISGGEVRDRKDLYKGVGLSNSDPFEAFRKNKAGSYYTRMKERSDFRK